MRTYFAPVKAVGSLTTSPRASVLLLYACLPACLPDIAWNAQVLEYVFTMCNASPAIMAQHVLEALLNFSVPKVYSHLCMFADGLFAVLLPTMHYQDRFFERLSVVTSLRSTAHYVAVRHAVMGSFSGSLHVFSVLSVQPCLPKQIYRKQC